MQTYYVKWTTYCTELYYGDNYRSNLSLNAKSTGGGDVMFGVNWDEDCLIDSGLDIPGSKYIYYTNYYDDGSKGEDVASYYEAIIYQWN